MYQLTSRYHLDVSKRCLKLRVAILFQQMTHLAAEPSSTSFPSSSNGRQPSRHFGAPRRSVSATCYFSRAISRPTPTAVPIMAQLSPASRAAMTAAVSSVLAGIECGCGCGDAPHEAARPRRRSRRGAGILERPTPRERRVNEFGVQIVWRFRHRACVQVAGRLASGKQRTGGCLASAFVVVACCTRVSLIDLVSMPSKT